MLRRLRISNYRSIAAGVALDLEPLTVLVGPNGAGKSNLVDALQFLADCMHLGLDGAVTKRSGIAAVRRWSSGRPFNVELGADLSLQGHQAHFSFTLAGSSAADYQVKSERAELMSGTERSAYAVENGQWREAPPGISPKLSDTALALTLVAGDERFAPLASALGNMAAYDIFPDALRRPHPYDPRKPMERLGDNWVSILRDQPKESWHPELVSVLHQLTGDIDDADVRPVGGFLTARFRHGKPSDSNEKKRTKWFDAGQESNGTLRVAGIVTALLQEPAPSLIAIEEPELTVHPGALGLIYDFVKQATERSQVIVTTHSPEFLDLVSPECVRAVQRNASGTTVRRISAAQQSSVKRGLMTLGEVLTSEGLQQELPVAGE